MCHLCVFCLTRCCQYFYEGWCNRQLGSGVSFKYYCQVINLSLEYTQRWFVGKRLKEEPCRPLGGACACLGASLKFKQTRLISCTWRGKSKEKSSQCSEICRRSHFCGVQASARIIWSIWHVHARYCTLCHVIPRALYSAACFAFLIPTAGRTMLRLEAPRRAQSCSGFSVF